MVFSVGTVFFLIVNMQTMYAWALFPVLALGIRALVSFLHCAVITGRQRGMNSCYMSHSWPMLAEGASVAPFSFVLGVCGSVHWVLFLNQFLESFALFTT